MIYENHNSITNAALGEAGMQPRALSFVVSANMDSDSPKPGCEECISQHFQLQDNCQRLSVESGKWYAESALEIAVAAFRTGRRLEMALGLYALGRALHCVQDFYAHSNWIVLSDDPRVWDGEYNGRIRVSKPTPSGDKHDNLKPWYRPTKPGTTEKFRLHDSDDRLDFMKMLESTTTTHPDSNFDGRLSFASRVFKKCRGRSGYRVAKCLAIAATRNLGWRGFREDVGVEAMRLMETFKPPWMWSKTTKHTHQFLGPRVGLDWLRDIREMYQGRMDNKLGARNHLKSGESNRNPVHLVVLH